MSTRVVRALVAVLALLGAGLVAGTANADPGVGTGTGNSTPRSTTTTQGNIRCTYYANSSGFGTWCGGSGKSGGNGGPPPTWRDRLRAQNGWPFIPCRNYEIPPGVVLPDPPEGKRWILRVWIRDYNLDMVNGGPDVHLEHEIVAVTDDEFKACRDEPYMNTFWSYFRRTYPTPILVVKPTYIPRVNSPAFFALGEDTTKNPPEPSAYTEVRGNLWNGQQQVAMQARVTLLEIDPGDGTPKFGCTNVTEQYDDTKKPAEQTASCKHVFKRSSANQPDGMFTLRISAHWQVRYCLWNAAAAECDWRDLGTWQVRSVQRLPVQEVQGIGGGR